MYEASRYPFSDELFANPTAEYRGAPFWSWNGAIRAQVLDEQIRAMKEMGLGGYHIHSRIGLETEYLGEDFMAMVRHCVEEGKANGMLTWLYDEDKWPSGFGGGRVTSDRKFAARYLLFSPNRYEEGFLDRHIVATSRLSKNGDITLLARYSIELQDGKLLSYRLLDDGEEAENIYYAYLVVTEALSWFNNQAYVDTLNPEAIRRFTEVTHERYREAVGEEFGKSIPAIFTDEPSFHMQEELRNGSSRDDIGLAYTEGLDDAFRNKYGISFFEILPELIWEKADGTLSQARYRYHALIAELFAKAYSKTLADWCTQHNLLLTGHLLFEDKLESQSRVIGETMQGLSYFTLPGIDMLADRHEYTTAKEAQSVSRQYGRPGVTCELYGVTNWDFDFRGHKHQGDWLAALGVTNRVHHLVWMTMSGESKRDYPSPLDQHTTWYRKYPVIENYFARLNTALTRGKAVCRIAMIHPVESYWMLMGPTEETKKQRDELEALFQESIEWLLFNQLDFDYVSESLLPDLYHESEDCRFSVGAMDYQVILVPGLMTIRSTTLKALEQFAEKGGKVIFIGQVPSYVDGLAADRAERLAEKATVIGRDRFALLDCLEPYREVEICDAGFNRAERLIYQLRCDDEGEWLFIAQGKHDDRLELSHWVSQTGREDFTVRVKGQFSAVRYDCETGEKQEVTVAHKNGCTIFMLPFYAQDAYLIRLLPTADTSEQKLFLPPERKPKNEYYLPNDNLYTLSEPNVLVLDNAAFRLDNGAWHDENEMLRLDAAVRALCGFSPRNSNFPQPWLEPVKTTDHGLTLRYSFEAEFCTKDVDVALELPENALIRFNGRSLDTEKAANGFYVDAAIRRFRLGKTRKGRNTLEISFPYGPGVNIENAYLLGNFGVRVTGARAAVVRLPEALSFGELASQGLPFYGGSVEYHTSFLAGGGNVSIRVPEFFGALIGVTVDGGEERILYKDPGVLALGRLKEGPHLLTLKLYGSRINTFGQLHNARRKERYWGNKTWRTAGKDWSYLYQLRKTGITLTPLIEETED